jgi:hypothetical protein
MNSNQYIGYVKVAFKVAFWFLGFVLMFIYYGFWLVVFGVISYILFSWLPEQPAQASIAIALLVYVARHVLIPGRAAEGRRLFTGSSGSGGAIGTGGGGCGGGGC